MRIAIREDFDGEVEGLSLEDLTAKLYAGFVRAADAMLDRKADMLAKAGGEVNALDELRETLHAGLQARLDGIRDEIAKGEHYEQRGEPG
mgnify:FL=1